MGRSRYAAGAWAYLGVGFALTGQRLQKPTLLGCRCTKPIGLSNCPVSVEGHHHVCRRQYDVALARIVAGVRGAVTAACSDGPWRGISAVRGKRRCGRRVDIPHLQH